MKDKEKALDILIKYIEDQNYSEISYLDINFKSLIHEIFVDNYICKIRELTWKEILEIDCKCFKKNKNYMYFSSEYEKREILKKALLEIKDKNNNKLEFNDLNNLNFNFLDKLWVEYQKFLHLSEDEIAFIYNSAKNYFDPNYKENTPLHPMILEIDYIIKGIVTYSKKEFEEISNREFETIQLIISTKNELN